MRRVIEHNWGGFQSTQYGDYTELIYYSGSQGTFGTPYTEQPTGINNHTNDDPHVTATSRNGKLIFAITNVHQPLNIAVYNLQGQTIAETLTDNNSGIQAILCPSSGIYIWKAFNNGFMQSGKVVMH